MRSEIIPTFEKQRPIDMDEMNGRAVQKAISDFNRFFMSVSAVEKCRHFVDDILRREERWRKREHASPAVLCSLMMLVVTGFERDEKTGIDENPFHE